MESPSLVIQIPFSLWLKVYSELKDENWDRRRYIHLIEQTWFNVSFSIYFYLFTYKVVRCLVASKQARAKTGDKEQTMKRSPCPPKKA